MLDETIECAPAHKIDVVLVDPQYAASLAQDDAYGRIVQIIDAVARQDRVPLVRRFEAMRYLAGQAKSPREEFRLGDLGYRCMAEHVARAITVSLLQAEAASARRARAAGAGTGARRPGCVRAGRAARDRGGPPCARCLRPPSAC